MNTDLIGFLAATLTTGCTVPQIIKILKTKHARDVSLIFAIMLGIGVSLWTIYGVLISSMPVIVANCITLLLSLTIIGLKFKYR